MEVQFDFLSQKLNLTCACAALLCCSGLLGIGCGHYQLSYYNDYQLSYYNDYQLFYYND